MEKSCETCTYFHSCAVDGVDIRGYCSTDPNAVGYCHLWDGERTTTEACEGWVAKNNV